MDPLTQYISTHKVVIHEKVNMVIEMITWNKNSSKEQYPKGQKRQQINSESSFTLLLLRKYALCE